MEFGDRGRDRSGLARGGHDSGERWYLLSGPPRIRSVCFSGFCLAADGLSTTFRGLPTEFHRLSAGLSTNALGISTGITPDAKRLFTGIFGISAAAERGRASRPKRVQRCE